MTPRDVMDIGDRLPWIDELQSPLLTDLYQLTMLQGYVESGMQGEAVFEFFVRRLPKSRNFVPSRYIASVVKSEYTMFRGLTPRLSR